MRKYQIVMLMLALSFFLVSCAHYPPDRYNTQTGAAVGAGMGALIGQAIGGNTESTLIGLAAGTILGALVGNAVDQDYQAARDAAMYGRSVIYYDKDGHAVEAIPEWGKDPNCQKVRKRIWENGKLVKETVEEVCGPVASGVPYYYPVPPPPPYYYGWWGWPVFPSLSFHFGRYYGYRHYPYYRGWRHRW